MTDITLIFAKSFTIGFSMAMILGPIGIMCIQHTLINGFWAGMVVGLGAATADGIFGLIAGLGLSLVTDFMLKQQFLLQLVGGAFLIYLGIRILFRQVPETQAVHEAGLPASTAIELTQEADEQHPHEPARTSTKPHSPRQNLFALYGSIVFLTLTSPFTIITFSALMTAAHIMPPAGETSLGFGILVLSGFFIGSMVWWIILTSALSMYRSRISPRILNTMSRVAGIAVITFGGLAMLRSLLDLV